MNMWSLGWEHPRARRIVTYFLIFDVISFGVMTLLWLVEHVE